MNDILVKVGADITDFSRKMAESNRALKGFADTNAQTFDSFKKVGATVTAVGTGLAYGLGKAVKTSIDFESGMSKVKAISGATGDEIKALEDRARELGGTTSFSAKEAADGLQYLALAGWDTEQMISGLEPVLHLAEAGALDLGLAADLVTDSMSALGLGVDDLDDYLDKVAKTSASANTDIDALMEAMVIAGGTFERFNIPLDEANAMLGVMANRGFKGSEAGTAMNAIMTRLTASTGPAADALKELGINVFDSEGNFRGMETVMKEVSDELSGLTDQERAHYQTQIAGLNHGKAFSAMLSGLGDEYDGLKDDIINSNGALREMRDIMKDNLEGDLEGLASAFEEAQIAIANKLTPAVRLLVQFLTNLLLVFNELSGGTKAFIGVVIALVAGIAIIAGPILLLIGFIPQIVAGFTALKTVILAVTGVLGGISAPILLVVAGIAVLVAALVIAYKKSEEFREGVQTAFTAIYEVIMAVVNAVVDFAMEIWGLFADWWAENNALIAEATSTAWNNLLTVITAVLGFLAPWIEAQWIAIKTATQVVWEAVKTYVMVAIEIISGIIKAVMQVINGDWTGAWETVKQTFVNVWNHIKEFGSNVVQIIKDNIKEKFTQIKEDITNLLTGAKDALVNKFIEMVSNARSKASEVVSTVRTKFSEVKNAIKEKMVEAVNIVRDKIAEMPEKVRDKILDMISAGKDLIGGLIEGIKDKAKEAVDAVKGVASDAIDGAKKLLGIKSPSRVFMQIGEFTGEGMALGMKASAKDVMKASDVLVDAATPNIDMSYATPTGIKSSLSSAVRGTVDVNNRDERLSGAINSLERRLGDLEVVMDGERVGRIIRPHINDQDAVEAMTRRYFD